GSDPARRLVHRSPDRHGPNGVHPVGDDEMKPTPEAIAAARTTGPLTGLCCRCADCVEIQALALDAFARERVIAELERSACEFYQVEDGDGRECIDTEVAAHGCYRCRRLSELRAQAEEK